MKKNISLFQQKTKARLLTRQFFKIVKGEAVNLKNKLFISVKSIRKIFDKNN